MPPPSRPNSHPRLGLKLTAAFAAIACIWVAVVWTLSYRYVGVLHLLRAGPDGQTLFAFESDRGRFALIRETQRITAVADDTTWQRTWRHGRDPDNALRDTLYLNTFGAPAIPGAPGTPEIGIAHFRDDFTTGLLIRYHVPFLAFAFITVTAAWRLLISSPASGRITPRVPAAPPPSPIEEPPHPPS